MPGPLHRFFYRLPLGKNQENKLKLRMLLASLVAISVAACGPSNEENTTVESAPKAEQAATETAQQTDVASGSTSAIQVPDEMAVLSELEATLAKLGCFACHAVDDKRIGPSYRSIAERYRGEQVTETLVGKIISGGGGVWSPMPMTSHPHLTPEVLTPLVEQILALPSK